MKPLASSLPPLLFASVASADAPPPDATAPSACRRTDKTCARDLLIPSLGMREAPPLDKPVEVTFTPEEAGELKLGCAMHGMVGGLFVVE